MKGKPWDITDWSALAVVGLLYGFLIGQVAIYFELNRWLVGLPFLAGAVVFGVSDLVKRRRKR